MMNENPNEPSHFIEAANTTDAGLPVAPSMAPVVQDAQLPLEQSLLDRRVVFMCFLAALLAVAAALAAQVLLYLISFFTRMAFHGEISFHAGESSPWNHQLGAWVIGVPLIGAFIVGLMARYGSKAIRGHGIPEAMEQVLTNQSRIPARMTFLKPLSAAIAIGTGGPFGAEGPIIATGGALGSLIGQIIRTSAVERKTLLAAGAAAGMSATFGSPVSAVLLAVELLLFEFRARSLVPVALATCIAAGIRISFEGAEPVFHMPALGIPTTTALLVYIALGAVMGLAAVIVTRAVYAVEDAFEKLPIHWMWWPMVGAVVVGVVGYFYPRTLGVGYENIIDILDGHWPLGFVAILITMKFVSWSVYLGSGTSGGTLAPLFTVGGGMGMLLGAVAARIFPHSEISLPVAALVGMAAIFAGSARALLASVVFAFETTLQPMGLLPLLGGCSASFLVSALVMRNTIMTEKIVRRGVRVPSEYAPDFLDQVQVSEMMSRNVVSLRGSDTLESVRSWIASAALGTSHQGFPVLDEKGALLGVVTRRQLLDPKHPSSRRVEELIQRPPIVVYDDLTLRAAADHMVNHDIGRLPVVSRSKASTVVGMITRSDLLRAHRRRLEESSPSR